MTRQQKLIASAVIALLASSPLLAASGPQYGAANGGNDSAQQQMIESGDCTLCATADSYEIATLVFMREEEKAARDLYTHAAALWQFPIFTHIAESEQRHMDSVGSLLTKYAIPDPVQTDATGLFANTDLQALYDELALRSEGSLVDALHVGALVEEVDIEDLENAIVETDNTDIAQVYESLLKGSRNHLRAFVREIERQGVVYEAQYLAQEAVDEIVDSPMERGGGNGNGNGYGLRGPGGRMAW